MLAASYLVAALAMFGSTAYLCSRLRLFLTTTTMLLGSLLLIYGPAYLSFMLSSGEKSMLFHRLSGSIGGKSSIFDIIQATSSDFNSILIAMNFSIALMFIGVIAGIEIVDRLLRRRTAAMQAAIAAWNSQSLRDNVGGLHFLLVVTTGLGLILASISIKENHIGTITEFLSISDDMAKAAYRADHGGSPSYAYRLILSAIAPMFVIWGSLAGWLNRSWPLLLTTGFLFVAVGIGKSEILGKAPPALFLIQLIVAGLLVFRNRMSGRSWLVVSLAVVLVFYVIVRLTMSSYDQFGGAGFLLYRVFEVPSESLLETFSAFPSRFPHTWGANIRPLSMLIGLDFTPAYRSVGRLWHSNPTSSNALFIADAWIDFSYLGVIAFSIAAGAICRSIDAFFLSDGKTVVGIAVLCAAFFGIFTLLVSALNTAALSGGLLLAPALAGILVRAIQLFKRWGLSSAATGGTDSNS
jgi:hypothetical protein